MKPELYVVFDHDADVDNGEAYLWWFIEKQDALNWRYNCLSTGSERVDVFECFKIDVPNLN